MKNMLNMTSVTQLRAHIVPRAFWRLVSKSCDEYKGSFARVCEAKLWSHLTCPSLGKIFQPMRINFLPDVKCFCNNKNVLRAQSMVWHFVRHPVYCYRIKEVCIKLVIGKKLYTMMHGQKNFKFSFVVCFSFDTGKNSLWLNSLWRPATSSCTVSSVTCLRSI